MLVWRITRPVAARREHFDDEQPMSGKLGLDDVIDLAASVTGAPDFYLDIIWTNNSWRERFLRSCCAEGNFTGRFSGNSAAASERQIVRPRLSGKRRFSVAD